MVRVRCAACFVNSSLRAVEKRKQELQVRNDACALWCSYESVNWSACGSIVRVRCWRRAVIATCWLCGGKCRVLMALSTRASKQQKCKKELQERASFVRFGFQRTQVDFGVWGWWCVTI